MSYQIVVATSPPGVLTWTNQSAFVYDNISISYGRQSVDDQIDSATCTLSMVLDSTLGTVDLDNFGLNYFLKVYATFTGSPNQCIRFYGNVTDISIDKDTMNVTAVSSLVSRFGKYTLEYPFSTSGLTAAVLQDIYYAGDSALPAGAPTPVWFAPGTVQLSHTFDGTENALEALTNAAQSEFFGLLYENLQNAQIASADTNSRGKMDPDFYLADDEMLDDWIVSKQVVSYVNQTTVNYESGTYTYTEANSAGTIQEELTTYLVNESDAKAKAFYNSQSRTNVKFSIPSVTIPIATLSTSRQQELIGYLFTEGLRINSYVYIGPIRDYIQTDYFVEGWTETITRSSWNLTLALSDLRRSRYYQRWDQVTPTLRWVDMDYYPQTEWLDLLTEWI